MAYDFRELKSRMKPEFHKNYGKYYPVKSLGQMGFGRSTCKKCGRGFWSVVGRDFCDEPACSGGYRFIGEKLTRKPFGYKEAWDEYVKVFGKWGYVPIKRYPVVCRWYEELYFVNAGINDFQPYVVAGDVAPPADAVLEPQFCLRFPDIDSVGVTGRHYTGFIMVGQHTFNTVKKHVYFKDEGILQMHEFLTKGLGIRPEEIFYHEDVWAGGGNFGPSMEFFSRGLELGNQVYMQYQVMPDGSHQELKTKVIDMGAGLERWSWFSQGVPMSYDTVFPKVMDYIYAQTGVKPESEIWNKFARYAGLLSFDEIEDSGAVWKSVAKEVGVDVEELKKEVFRMRALYAIGEHTRTLLVGIHDGALPSNVGGGYNLRNILRRCWSFMDEYGFDFELEKVFEKHIDEFGGWYTELRDVGSLWDILAVERARFDEGKRKTKAIVERMIADKEEFTAEKLAQLYDSQGIHPNMIRDFKQDLVVPDNFYKLVEDRHERSVATEKTEVSESAEKKLLIELVRNTSGPTQPLYYDNLKETKFEAKILKAFSEDAKAGRGSIILDVTLFYPEGGGQESDKGVIMAGGKKLEVYEVDNHKGVVEHKVTGFDSSLLKAEGTAVKCEVDGERRTQLMQHHTATHIINAAANKVLGPHIWQAGAHKSADIARLDVTHYKAVSDEELRKIEEEANRIISAGIEVKKMTLPRDEAEKRYGFRIYQGGAVPGTELRIIEIAGVDAEACGGTHLDNTREAEKIKVVKASRIQDGVVRIEFKAGNAAKKESTKEGEIFAEAVESLPVKLKDESFDKSTLQKAAATVGVQPENLTQTIKRFVKEWSESRVAVKISDASNLATATESLFEGWKSARKQQESAASDAAGKLAGEIEMEFAKNKVVKKIVEGLSVPALMKAANDAVTKDGRTLVLVNIAGDKCNIVVSSSNKKINAGKIAEELSKKLGGGGRGTQNLGVGGGKAKDAERFLSDFRI